MTPILILLLSLFSIIILMILGIPVVFTLGIVSVSIFIIRGYSLIQIPHLMTTGIESFVFIVIPFFILTGKLMNSVQLTDRIFNFADKLVGHFRGGLGHVNILASLIFAGMSGSALADVQGLGIIEIKAMTDKGYDKKFAAVVTMASSVIGPIFPPSIPMVIYAVIAEVSVAKLFLSGVIPGIMMALAMMILVYFISKNKKNFPVSPKASFYIIFALFVKAIPALIIPIFLLGAILFGVATPTEIGIISILYIFIIDIFVYKKMNFKKYWQAIKETVSSTSSMLIIVCTAMLYGRILALEQVPQGLANYVLSLTQNPIIFLLIINILLLTLGCFLDTTTVMLLTLPVLLPTVKLLGINLVHFGIIVVFNLMIGLITPPFGLCLYAIAEIIKIPAFSLVKPILPFLIPLIICLVIITFLPGLVLFLPNLIK